MLEGGIYVRTNLKQNRFYLFFFLKMCAYLDPLSHVCMTEEDKMLSRDLLIAEWKESPRHGNQCGCQ